MSNTAIYKDIRNSWHAETHVDLGENKQLRLSTWKTDRGLQSFASVCKLENGCVTHMMYADYSKRVILEKARCTEKAVREQHDRALKMLPVIMDDVTRHYNREPALLA